MNGSSSDRGGFRLEREMGIARADFFRTLPGVLREGDTLQKTMDSAVIELAGGGRVEIELSDPRERRLGSLVLPTLTVGFRFRDLSAERRNAWLDRFDIHFRRGGG